MSDYDEGYRAGMQIVRELAHKRIEELEAKLAAKEKLMLALAGDKINLVSELAGVKGKLAKAVETIKLCRKMQAQFTHTEDPLMVLLDTTIAELSSVSCANLKG